MYTTFMVAVDTVVWRVKGRGCRWESCALQAVVCGCWTQVPGRSRDAHALRVPPRLLISR